MFHKGALTVMKIAAVATCKNRDLFKRKALAGASHKDNVKSKTNRAAYA